MMCLYIAGTLFAMNGATAIPVGPHTSMTIRGEEVAISVPGGFSDRLPRGAAENIGQWLEACDEEATLRVMEREDW